MNYSAIYHRLVARVSESEYTERHHIHPRCLGGNDSLDNIAILSWSEHRLAHLLLTKMYPGNKDLLSAAWLMTHLTSGNRVSRKTGEWLKRKFISSISGDKSHFKRQEVRDKIAKATSDYLKKYPHLHPMKREDVRALYASKMRGSRNPMNNPESRGKVAVALSRYYMDNPDKNLMLDKTHREKLNNGVRKWFAENPGTFAGENNPMYGRKAENSPVYGKRIINNGTNERRIPRDENLPAEWKEGRLKHGRKLPS